MIKMGEASDLFEEIFGINEFEANSLNHISIVYQGMVICIWNDDGLNSILIGLPERGRVYFSSVVGRMLDLNFMDASYKLQGLKMGLNDIKEQHATLLDWMKAEDFERKYHDKSGFEPMKL